MDGAVEARGRLIEGDGQSFQSIAGAVRIKGDENAFRTPA